MKNLFRTAITAFLLLLVSVPGEGAFKLPTPEKIVLPNGLTVYCLKSSEVPIVSFRMFIRGAGSAYEPGALEGAANLTADLLLKGTTKMNADAVAEALDFMGADLGISAAEEYAQVSAESLSEHFPKLMEIVADCLIEPAFKEDEFAKERAKRIDNIKAVKDDPGSAVSYYFQKAYFGAHPMGHLSLGTESALAKMTIQNIRGFYKARFRPDRAVAAVVGDIDRAKLAGLLKATLGRWKAASGNAPAHDIPALPRPKGPKLVLVDKPDATQAYFVMGAPGYPMGDKVTPEAEVMNTLFGGRFTSWLNTELRIKRGLTYGVSSSFQAWAAGGLFSATSYTQNSKIGEMLDITYDLLKKGTGRGFSAEEVESTRNYIQGQFPPTLETNADKAAAYVRLAFYKLGFDYYGKYLAGIGAVSAAGAGKAAATFLPANDYVLVVVGKAVDIKPLLAKFGTWEEKKITDPDF
jgi:predicted Zn-dependent peptidase